MSGARRPGAEGAPLLEKIRQRRLLQIALFYVGAAWIGVEITDFIVGTYGFSRKILDTMVFLAILGFPAFLVIGWYHGARGRQRIRRAEAWLLVTLASLGGIGTYRIATAEPPPARGAEVALPVVGAADAGDARTVAAPDLGQRSLAVLPFRNNIQDPELQWLGAGLADLLTTNLAQLPGVLVVGRQSLYDLLTEEGRSEEEEIPEGLAMTVARGAGARMLLWGSVTGTAADMRIDAQLIELENGTVASADFARGGDVFELVDTLTARLSDRLTGTAPSPAAEVVRISHLGTTDLAALGAFHRGNALARAGRTEEAEAHFQRAITLDSAFALPLLASRGAIGSQTGAAPEAEAGTEGEADVEGSARITMARGRNADRLLRRLPPELRESLEGLSGEELRLAIDSLTHRARTAIALLSGRSPPSGPRPDTPPPDRPPPDPDARR